MRLQIESRSARVAFYLIVAAICVAAAAVVATRLSLSYKMRHQLSPAEIGQMREFFRSDIPLPYEDERQLSTNPHTIMPSALPALRRDFELARAGWEIHEEPLRRSPFAGPGLGFPTFSLLSLNEARTTASALLKNTNGWLRNLLRGSEELGKHSLRMFAIDDAPSSRALYRYPVALAAAKLLCTRAMIYADARQFKPALDDIDRAVLLARVVPPAGSEERIAANELIRATMRFYAELALVTRDKDPLIQSLIFLRSWERELVSDSVSSGSELYALPANYFGGEGAAHEQSAFPFDLAHPNGSLWEQKDSTWPNVHIPIEASVRFVREEEGTTSALPRQSLLPVSNLTATTDPVSAYDHDMLRHGFHREFLTGYQLFDRWRSATGVDFLADGTSWWNRFKKNFAQAVARNEDRELLYARHFPAMEFLAEDERLTRAHYDLAMLNAAQQVYLLTTQKELTDPAGLIPQFALEIPPDPFSDRPYRWSTKLHRFYSIGPDRKDDHLTRIARPEAGEKLGDIVLP